MPESKLLNFYKDCNVFITGGTGFMGKILVEKLLRSTSVSTVYLLVRPKHGKGVEERFNIFFEDVVFNRLKEKCPNFRDRVVGLEGDASIAGLGLSHKDRDKIISNVHIVFNAAATVRFDENLKLAYSINVSGVKETLELAKQMTKLKSIMHVSTAFSNSHMLDIKELIYDYQVSYEKIGLLLEKMSTEEAHIQTDKIKGKWPNTYTFTKALAESLIKDKAKGLPIGIFRPSIVISTHKEPVEGWIDNVYGPTGIVAGVSSGLLRVMYCDGSKNADIVPVDTCVSGLLAAAWEVSTKSESNIPVYNYVNFTENPITWGEFRALNVIHGRHYPLNKTMWTLLFTITTNKYFYTIMTFLTHILPAIFIDAVSILFGKYKGLLSTYKKIHKFCSVLDYFTMNEWTFENDNVIKLWEKLDKHEQEIFPFSMKTVHWLSFYRNYYKGVRKYLMKEPTSTLPSALKKQFVFDILHYVLKGTIYFSLSIFVWTFVIGKIFS